MSPTPLGTPCEAMLARYWPGLNGGKWRSLAQRFASASAVESLSSLRIATLTPRPVSPDRVAPYALRNCWGRYPHGAKDSVLPKAAGSVLAFFWP